MAKFRRFISSVTLFIICSLVISLSNISLDIGPNSPTSLLHKLHCPKNSRCYWTTETTAGDFRLQIKVTISDLLAGLLASCLVVIGDMTGTPYIYLPWLLFCIRNMLTLQGPAIFRFGFAAMSLDRYSASAIMLISVFLYAEEWCLWFEILNSFRILWMDRKSKLLKDISLVGSRKNHDLEDVAQKITTQKEFEKENKSLSLSVHVLTSTKRKENLL